MTKTGREGAGWGPGRWACAFAPGSLAPVPAALSTLTAQWARTLRFNCCLACLGLSARGRLGVHGSGWGGRTHSVRIYSTQAPFCCSSIWLHGSDSCLHWPCECLPGNDDALELTPNHRCAVARSFTHQWFHPPGLGREAGVRPPHPVESLELRAHPEAVRAQRAGQT